jgi:tetratricopeptide (TPR) repeat protein
MEVWYWNCSIGIKQESAQIFRLLRGHPLKNNRNNSFRVILIIACSALFSCASTGQKQLKSRDAEVYNNRGFAYCEIGQYDQAISDFSKAIEINPRLAPAYNNRGAAYLYTAQYDQAVSDLSKALEIDPRLAHAYNNRGWAYIKMEQYDEAVSDFNKTIEIDPRLAEVYFYRAIVYSLLEEYDKALLDAIKAQKLGYQIPVEFIDNLRKGAGAVDG